MTSVSLTTPMYRIGAVAKLTGLPVTTLRGWESRYNAFTPEKSSGKHRLYCESDVVKANLLKQLSQGGHGISSIAPLDVAALSRLVQQSQVSAMTHTERVLNANRINIAVVGLGLASRIEAKKFTLSFVSSGISISELFFDVAAASQASFMTPPQLMLIKTSSLHESSRAEIAQLIKKHELQRVIVIYNYGQENVVEAMRLSGIIVRREPLTDDELADLICSVLLVDAAQLPPSPGLPGKIAPRKYSEKTLVRVAGISSDVLCECPRHVAELITQLASFEQYSQECLNKSTQDADLHAYLTAVSGSARALFERALERVASHEGIDLSEN